MWYCPMLYYKQEFHNRDANQLGALCALLTLDCSPISISLSWQAYNNFELLPLAHEGDYN